MISTPSEEYAMAKLAHSSNVCSILRRQILYFPRQTTLTSTSPKTITQSPKDMTKRNNSNLFHQWKVEHQTSECDSMLLRWWLHRILRNLTDECPNLDLTALRETMQDHFGFTGIVESTLGSSMKMMSPRFLVVDKSI